MMNLFRKAIPSSPAEAALASWGIEYIKQADGTLLVEGDLDLSDREPVELPDLSDVRVKGFLLLHQPVGGAQGFNA